MAAVKAPVLLADIGGTNARFALAAKGELGPISRLPVAEHSGPAAALGVFLASCRAEEPLGAGALPRRALLAVAGPVEGSCARLTNQAWSFDTAELERDTGLERITLVNDFAAIAWALPRLGEEHLLAIGGGAAVTGEPVAVLGPGTGLGVAGALPGADGGRVLVTEGGHVTLAAADRRESALLDRLRDRFGHVSAERVLSGPGLTNLYAAIAAEEGRSLPARSAREITDLALAGDCPTAVATLEAFCAMLGTLAGNLALTLGARGGLYLAGGILPRVSGVLAQSPFRARFEAKGRFRDYLAKIPTKLILHPDPAFQGLLALAERGPA